MKKLNWDTIPSQNVLGKVNVWTSNRPQRDLVLDIQAMEELFSHVDKAATLRTSRRGGVKALDGLELFPLEHQVNSFQPYLMSSSTFLLRGSSKLTTGTVNNHYFNFEERDEVEPYWGAFLLPPF